MLLHNLTPVRLLFFTMPALKNSLSLSLLLRTSSFNKSLPKSAARTLAASPYRAPIRSTLAPCAAPVVAYKKQVGFGKRRGGERKLCFSTAMGFETPPEKQSEKLLTLPTILTIGRVAAVPLLVGTFYVDSWWGTTSTTSIFIIAAITDWLDGYIARKMRLGSAFGAFLDPVADKLMVAATLILLCTRPFEVPLYGQVPWVLTVPAIAIIGREITMSAVREWAASQNGKLSEAVAVNNLGKWKTATQMTALIILLATRDSSLAQSGTLVGSGVVLLYVSAWLSVWSLFVYTRKIWKVLLK